MRSFAQAPLATSADQQSDSGAEAPAPPRPRIRLWLVCHRAQAIELVLGLFSIACCVAIWQLLTSNGVNLYIRFENIPTPAAVVQSARHVLGSAEFGDHVVASCRRIALGFVIAALVAVPLALLMGRFSVVRALTFPVAEIIRPIPAIAWVPLAIMLWPTNEESIVFITFIGAFFPVLVNTLHGVNSVDPVLVRAARCLGAKELAVFREVYLPGALPHIFTGLTVGMGVAWVSLIAAEMISGQYGIGYFTWQAYALVDYPGIVFGMITIGLLGLGAGWTIRLVGRFIMPWGYER